MTDWTLLLERHLSELVRLQEELLAVVRRRYEAMARRDVVALERLMAEEQKLAAAVYEQESRRRLTMARLGGPMGRTPEAMQGMQLSEVIEWLGTEARERLAPLSEKLKRVTRQIGQVNRTSLMLAQRFLPYFEELLSILVEGSLGNAGYTSGGRAARGRGANLNLLDVTV